MLKKQKRNKSKLKLAPTTVTVMFLAQLFTGFFLPSSAQSGLSNIGSFFHKERVVEKNNEAEINNALTIKEVLIEGNRLVPEEHILKAIDSKVGTKFDKDKVLSDLEALDKLGYFIRESIQAKPEKIEDGILLKIRIEENNAITRVQVLGNQVIGTDALLIVVQDLIGKPESLTKISQVLEQIEQKYQESGFLLAKVTDIEMDPDGTLTVHINEGAIDKVTITGNTKTKEKYIRRFIPNLSTGEPYNELLLVQDLRALQGTGLFDDLKRTLKPSDSDPSKYDLNLEVVEKRSTSFGFGGGVNTLNGVFTNIGFSNNNLFGEGKRFSLNTQVGTGILANTLVDQRFLSNKKTIQAEMRYSDPNFLGTKNSVSIFTHGYTFNSYLVDLAQERNLGAGVSLMRPLGKNISGGFDLIGESVKIEDYGTQATDFLTTQILNVDNGKFLGDINEKHAFKPGQSLDEHEQGVRKQAANDLAKKLRNEQLQSGNYLQFNPTLVFDNRDNPANPRNGWNNKINAGGAIGIGNSSYTKLGIDLRRYIPIGQKTTLAFNLQGASGLIGDIPMYGQFKAGGFYGVRGYRAFSDLGIGSRSLLASAEIRTPLLDTIPGIQNTPLGKDLKLVLFSDLGYVGGNSDINRLFNRLNTAISAGIGFRANIPILGPIRVDYGMPFIKPLWDNKNIFGRFNFGLGERF